MKIALSGVRKPVAAAFIDEKRRAGSVLLEVRVQRAMVRWNDRIALPPEVGNVSV